VVTPTSRRAFLMGRRTAATPFEQFCARLERTCLGSVRTEPSIAQLGGAPLAWLKPVRQEDVAHARALCQEYRVALMLEGVDRPTERAQATLWVSPQPAGATLSLVDARTGVWRADAGCTVEQLKETGVFAGMSLAPELTLAQWFAWPETVRSAVPSAVRKDDAHSLERPCVSTEREGGCELASVMPDALRLVEQVEVLLADGTVEVFGPFGATAQAPLRSLTVQRLVPKLFELAGSGSAQRCAQLTPWPGRYRLDALIASATHEPNLAQLLFGHQGRLGWLQTLWLKRADTLPQVPRRALASEQDRELALQLDQELKHILDPLGVFGSNSNLKRLESSS